jgi:hypothetical protein
MKALEVGRVQVGVRKKSVGSIIVAHGNAWLLREDGQKLDIKVGRKVYEKDSILTGPSGKVKVVFNDGSRTVVTPDSRFKVEYLKINKKSGTKQTLHKLLFGKVRAHVEGDYKRKNQHYKIKSPTAVAGVRGTDFVFSYSPKQGKTQVETLTGTVQLGGLGADEKILIPPGRGGSFVVASNNEVGVFEDEDINQFVYRGKLSPVYDLTVDQMNKLDRETTLEDGREVASKESVASICSAPNGDFNDCYWKCVNNPRSAKSCRTDLKSVHCIRRRCNAAGKWSDEERLPASARNRCEADRVVVAPCDY